MADITVWRLEQVKGRNGDSDWRLYGCVECGGQWVAPISVSFECPHCGAWEGDHHLSQCEPITVWDDPDD